MRPFLRLRGMNGPFQNRTWQSAKLLRVGRRSDVEILLEDASVSRHHAEIRSIDGGWHVSDLGSTNGTRLNGVLLEAGQWSLHRHDVLQFGDVCLLVEQIFDATSPENSDDLRFQTTANGISQGTLQRLAFDSNHCPQPGDQMLALLRASHHLVHLQSEEELLHSILQDAVSVLNAQRGTIVLAENNKGPLKLKAMVNGQGAPDVTLKSGTRRASRPLAYSHNLALRCLQLGESILCQHVEEDPQLATATSIVEGAMASVMCLLLRTPRRRLGVLHLDRSPWQDPFTMEDLQVADALAANASAGIECAVLLREQRDLFLDTITLLAQAVELRDEYTGGHTFRVTSYSVLLAEQVDMSARNLELIQLGTPLHDIGKIGIDDAILRKPGRLTPEELEIMKTHTVKGAEILATIPSLQPIIPIVRSHHERWDGSGYPDGIGGEVISPLARVVAVADTFDAMTSDRPYRKGMAPEVAFIEIEKQAGKQLDPVCADAFLTIQNKILEAMHAQQSLDRSVELDSQATVPLRHWRRQTLLREDG